MVMPGTHYVTAGSHNRSSPPVIQTSGSLANPIVFFAQYPAVYNADNAEYLSTIISDGTANGCVLGMAGLSREYHAYDGLACKQTNGSYSGGELAAVSIFECEEAHAKFLRCLFDQENEGNTDPAQNWGSVFGQNSAYVEFSDCIFRRVPGSYNDENAMNHVYYDVGYLVVKHCEFDRVTGMAFLKGKHAYSGWDLRPQRWHHNKVVDHTQPSVINLGSVGADDEQPGEFADFYQNVIETTCAVGGAGLAVQCQNYNSGAAPINVRVVNNTFRNKGASANSASGALRGAVAATSSTAMLTGFQDRNNIRIESGHANARAWYFWAGWDATGISRLTSNNNAWSGFNESSWFVDEGSTNESRTDWQALGTGRDADSYFGTVTLEDPANGDYRCATAALLQGGANDGIDILNLRGLGTSAPINLGAFILSDQSDTIGVRPQSVTDAESLNWTYPY